MNATEKQKRPMPKEVAELLNEIGRRLTDEDKQTVARQCGEDECAVRDVLNGRVENAYMMELLYARAVSIKLLRRDFYSPDGAERLLKGLRTINKK